MERIVRQRLHECVVDQLKEYIIQESLRPGDSLPTEQELGVKLGVGRATVREALRVLEGFGIIETRPRTGIRVKSLSMKPIMDHLRFSLDLHGVTVAEMWEARQTLECALLATVVKNGTDDDFERIERAIRWASELWDAGVPIAPADLGFHLAIVAATHNRALESLARMLEDFFSTVLGGFVAGHDAIEDHEKILAALRARDITAAQDMMREHVRPGDPGLVPPASAYNGEAPPHAAAT